MQIRLTTINGHPQAELENDRLLIRYGWIQDPWQTDFRMSCFIDKRHGIDHAGQVGFDAASGRGPLIRAEEIHRDARSATVRLTWLASRDPAETGERVSEITIFAGDCPWVRIDYRHCWVNVWEIPSPGGDYRCDYAIHGEEHWKRGPVLYPLIYFSAAPERNDHAYMNSEGIDDPTPLLHHGWFVLTCTNRTNGTGYGRLAPGDVVNIVKLLHGRGFECFPDYGWTSRPWTSWLFLCDGGPSQALTLGRRLAADIAGPRPAPSRPPVARPETADRQRTFTVHADGIARLDAVVAVATALGAGASRYSLRLVELSSAGTVVDADVPFQFDAALADPTAGELVWQVRGLTAADGVRTYRLHWRGDGQPVSPHVGPLLVRTNDEQDHRGKKGIEITTPTATWTYHTEGGGFCSLLDRDGADWVGHWPAGGSAGQYRGFPNLGEAFHPGLPEADDGTPSRSTLVAWGPVRTVIESETIDGRFRCRWTILPTHATQHLLVAKAPYWWLYEGTPGGRLDQDRDVHVLGDGSVRRNSERWDGKVPNGWLYFRSQRNGRCLVLAKHQEDDAPDQYWPMDHQMTVFGFGRRRDDQTRYLTAAPAAFSVGFVEGGDHAEIAQRVAGWRRPMRVAAAER